MVGNTPSVSPCGPESNKSCSETSARMSGYPLTVGPLQGAALADIHPHSPFLKAPHSLRSPHRCFLPAPAALHHPLILMPSSLAGRGRGMSVGLGRGLGMPRLWGRG